jgi:hypothetical protein
MGQLKSTLRDQYLLLRLDEERAVESIPTLLPNKPEDRARTLRAVQRVVSAAGELSAEGRRRLNRVESLFGTNSAAPTNTKEESDVGA